MVPMRAEPTHRSELVNQMLFGELFTTVGKTRNGEWLEIKLAHDDYTGWVDANQITEISSETFKQLLKQDSAYSTMVMDLITADKQNSIFLTPGCRLPLAAGSEEFCINEHVFEYNGPVSRGKRTREDILHFAYTFLNTPYLWGGRTPLGIDCSGFSQIVYRLAGCSIPRDASQQATIGNVLSFIEESQPGDLAFFDNDERRITHVGIILPNNQIIHASGKVRIDGLDQYGIYNRERRDHTHRLRLMKEIF
jgi:gamma-D-glutamyl-L-lysine dipeptidyl-peptidase